MTDTDASPTVRAHVALAVLSAALAALVALDLATDARSGLPWFHVAVEGAVIAIGVSAAAWFAVRVRALGRHARELREEARGLEARLEASRQEAARWRQDAGDLIAGLSAAIDRQLAAWGLTPAEREVARLLLKGLSHKEIAQVRDVSETTVRQQARALYRKAGLSGRNDLAAFFLEDLLGAGAARDAPKA